MIFKRYETLLLSELFSYAAPTANDPSSIGKPPVSHKYVKHLIRFGADPEYQGGSLYLGDKRLRLSILARACITQPRPDNQVLFTLLLAGADMRVALEELKEESDRKTPFRDYARFGLNRCQDMILDFAAAAQYSIMSREMSRPEWRFIASPWNYLYLKGKDGTPNKKTCESLFNEAPEFADVGKKCAADSKPARPRIANKAALRAVKQG